MARNIMDDVVDTHGVGGNVPTHIVGLGASAGGLEALQLFFDSMEADSGLAFVVIQHLSPDYKSLMVELLSRHTKMEVMRAEDQMEVEANKIYLIPPKNNMAISGGRLQLTEQEAQRTPNLPIDIFFRALAEDLHERSVAVVLSGTGSDGTRGVRAIREAGGLIMVQDEQSAKFSGMPTSAIATGLADYIMSPDDMAGQLLKYVSHPGSRPAGRVFADTEAGQSLNEQLSVIVRRQTGLDFEAYKATTVSRRIERRMSICQVDGLADYLELLRQSPREVSNLAKDLLISVTKFFRDTECFESLRDKVLSQLFQNDKTEGPVRIWVIGCATGEEAYSLAMLCDDYLINNGIEREFKIFATDIDKEAIEFASTGVYPKGVQEDMPEDFFKRYFAVTEQGHQIERRIRDKVVFATQNILKDPPFTKIDLITCRNLLIYLRPPVQKRVLSLMHFALRQRGHILLGSSETIGDLLDAFDPIDSKNRIYRRKGHHSLLISDALTLASSSPRMVRSEVMRDPVMKAMTLRERAVTGASDQLLTSYAPTSLLVTERLEMIHSFGRPAEFLQISPGQATFSLTKLLPKDLSIALSTAANRVLKEELPITYRNIRVSDDEAVHLRVEPVAEEGPEEQLLLLVIFEKSEPEKSPAHDGESFSLEQRSIQRITDLEQELQGTKEHLQATIEELETSNEELQATNEELLASNEELQSTNEELESVNEELYTVNSEYQSKIGELTDLNNDMLNFMNSSDIGTIFLDPELRIRRYTPSIAREINVLPHDLGRPVTDLSHPLIDYVKEAVQEVRQTGKPVDSTVDTKQGSWYLTKILPYETEDRKIEGLVISVVNITPLKLAQKALEENEKMLSAVLSTVQTGICVTDENGIFTSVNDAFCRIYRYSSGELIGKHFSVTVPEDSRSDAQNLYEDYMRSGREEVQEVEVLDRAGQIRKIEARSSLLRLASGSRFRVTVVKELEGH